MSPLITTGYTDHEVGRAKIEANLRTAEVGANAIIYGKRTAKGRRTAVLVPSGLTFAIQLRPDSERMTAFLAKAEPARSGWSLCLR